MDWKPSSGPLQSPIQSLTYAFQPVNAQVRRGYRGATIKLNYRFLQCADEIQIAYSMDAKSLDYDPRYYDYYRSGANPTGTVSTSTPADAPSSIPIDLRVYKMGAGVGTTIAMVKDATANEALGMGCFSGQTKRVGLISKLLGANATKADIRTLLNNLRAAEQFSDTNTLPFPLLNSGATLPDDAAPEAGGARPAKRTPAKRPVAEVTPSDAAPPSAPRDVDLQAGGSTTLNAAGAAAAADQTRRIAADKAAYAKAVADQKAKYEADMAAYRAKVAVDKAEADRKQAAWDARNALYKACVAGDKDACTKYNAGQ